MLGSRDRKLHVKVTRKGEREKTLTERGAKGRAQAPRWTEKNEKTVGGVVCPPILGFGSRDSKLHVEPLIFYLRPPHVTSYRATCSPKLADPLSCRPILEKMSGSAIFPSDHCFGGSPETCSFYM